MRLNLNRWWNLFLVIGLSLFFLAACAEEAELPIVTLPTPTLAPTVTLIVRPGEPAVPDESEASAAAEILAEPIATETPQPSDTVSGEAETGEESVSLPTANKTGSDEGGEGPIVLSMWYHGAENEAERAVLLQIVKEFNAAQTDYFVELLDFPEESYNESVTSAALVDELPDILDVDGPVMPHWAWAGYLQPLDLPEEKLAQFLPGTLGYWSGELYSVGLWDAAIALFARRSVLEAQGIRIPTLDDPWTLQEFDDALVKLQSSGEFAYPLDVGMAWTGEWYPYAFSPLMQSFGGDILDRSTYMTAQGALNGSEAINFGAWWQSLFERGLVPGPGQDGADRDTGFIDGQYGLQWNGNWAALPALEAYGEDMLFLPAPDFGNGGRIGAASWQFGVSSTSAHPEGARAFISFALQDRYLAAFSEQTGLIPSTLGAAALTEKYAPGGPLELFFELSNAQGTLRPPTPAYLSAALTFERALLEIANGADIVDTLDAAAAEIDADIAQNDGYGFDGSVVGDDIQNDGTAP